MVAVRRCSLDEVAALFSMNCRRINRRLECQRTTFHRIAQDALCAQAERLMRDTEMALGEFSAALDTAEAGVFTRAFRGWRGDARRLASDACTRSGFRGRLTATFG